MASRPTPDPTKILGGKYVLAAVTRSSSEVSNKSRVSVELVP